MKWSEKNWEVCWLIRMKLRYRNLSLRSLRWKLHYFITSKTTQMSFFKDILRCEWLSYTTSHERIRGDKRTRTLCLQLHFSPSLSNLRLSSSRKSGKICCHGRTLSSSCCSLLYFTDDVLTGVTVVNSIQVCHPRRPSFASILLKETLWRDTKLQVLMFSAKSPLQRKSWRDK